MTYKRSHFAREGEVTLRKPKKTKAPERTSTTMRLPVDLMDKLATVAASEGRSRSNLVEHILRREIETKHKKVADTVFA